MTALLFCSGQSSIAAYNAGIANFTWPEKCVVLGPLLWRELVSAAVAAVGVLVPVQRIVAFVGRHPA